MKCNVLSAMMLSSAVWPANLLALALAFVLVLVLVPGGFFLSVENS
jgi:hypothetical protein